MTIRYRDIMLDENLWNYCALVGSLLAKPQQNYKPYHKDVYNYINVYGIKHFNMHVLL